MVFTSRVRYLDRLGTGSGSPQAVFTVSPSAALGINSVEQLGERFFIIRVYTCYFLSPHDGG
jgi:hypothetical protein